MKAIIEGKRYNTETATKLGDGGSTTDDRSNFRYFEESLYVTKAGRFFLAGKGGPLSRYAKSTGQNSWSSGETMAALNKVEAFKWACENLSPAETERHFADMVEDA